MARTVELHRNRSEDLRSLIHSEKTGSPHGLQHHSLLYHTVEKNPVPHLTPQYTSQSTAVSTVGSNHLNI